VPFGKSNPKLGPRTPRRLALATAAIFIAACATEVPGQPEPRAASDDRVAAGRRLIASYGCGSCHSIPGVPGADSKAAPPLDRFYQRTYIAGRLPNTEDSLVSWIQNPQRIEPGTAMPVLGVTEEEARAMSAYLYRKPTLSDLFNWWRT
jgi:cytochrome c